LERGKEANEQAEEDPVDGRSDKHGPRLDDALSSEAEPLERGGPESGRIEDHRMTEAPGTGRPPADPAAAGESGDDLGPMGVRSRSELARHLEPHVFPAAREELLASVRDRPGAEEVVQVLRRLPEGARFENVQDVWEALGGGEDRPV
jgi:uncharacterized protein DUF2795